MPLLGNPRQENYCKHRAKGMKPAQAALVAGYAAGSGTQSNLEDNPEIQARIVELMEQYETERQARREAAITSAQMVGAVEGSSKSWVMQQLARNAMLASDAGEYGASNSALKLMGDELGMFKGGSSGNKDEDDLPQFDLDHISNQIDRAETNRPVLPPPVAGDEMFVPEATVLSMLGEGVRRPPNLAEDRKISTGSETDIALHDDFNMPPEDEAP